MLLSQKQLDKTDGLYFNVLICIKSIYPSLFSSKWKMISIKIKFPTENFHNILSFFIQMIKSTVEYVNESIKNSSVAQKFDFVDKLT
jgi:hypothetical protein